MAKIPKIEKIHTDYGQKSQHEVEVKRVFGTPKMTYYNISSLTKIFVYT